MRCSHQLAGRPVRPAARGEDEVERVLAAIQLEFGAVENDSPYTDS